MSKAEISSPPGKGPAASMAGFTTLSELDQQPMTLRDWLSLLPAVLASLVLNGVLMMLLIFFNAGNAQAHSRLRELLGDEATQAADKHQADENPPIDINTPEFNAPKDIVQSEKLAMPALDPSDKPAGMTEPPKEKEIIGMGASEDGKLRGADATGLEALRGDPIFAEMGGIGAAGSMPLGSGAGIISGAGGGSSKAGGFGYRTGDLSSLAKRMGGSDESERAVALGLLWLRMHQSSDGRWSIDKYHTYDAKCNCRTEWEKDIQRDEKGKPLEFDGKTRNLIRADDVSGTVLGLLPFLGAGHHQNSPKEEGRIVSLAMRYLLSRQRPDGSFKDPDDSRHFDMYTQGLATIALCEAYGMTSDARLREAAQRAVLFICKVQNPIRGGWRYAPSSSNDGDTSVAGWQVMALKSAQIAGLNVPAQSLELASRWLDYAEYKTMRNGRPRIRYSYEIMNDLAVPGRFVPKGAGTNSTTAAGLLNRLYLGWGPRNASMIAGCDEMMDALPPADPKSPFKDIYYWYYASQVMHHMGGEYWDTWNPRMRDYLVKSQEKSGHKAGSWDPTGDHHAKTGGRLYETSLAILTLEVYYRHLPLYRREKLSNEGEPAAKPIAPESKDNAADASPKK
jgi:hypothetical protein